MVRPLSHQKPCDVKASMCRLSFRLSCKSIILICGMALLRSGRLLAETPTTSIGSEVPQFERDVRPILREYCLDCHGATEKHEGGLDLRLVRFMAKGGESGTAIVPGKADESLLIQRIESEEMPPGETKVTPEKLAILKAWVAAGATAEKPEPETIAPGIPLTQAERSYWAYRPLARPQLKLADEAAKEGSRLRNGIDQIVKAAMPEGLDFAPDSPREKLIRRVFIDLIGVPPTPQQWERWANDAGDDWYDAMIDTLLQSPQYGERWARHWLDAAGYADSDGATLADAERAWAWRYRDYVIRSLNDDKPIDRFVTEQLAGDELAGPANGDWTPQQIECLTATGFLRMTADGTGSGDNSPEARNKTIADTMQVVGNTLLGSSLQCAQCHDHRYDPISHEDYFSIRAVFDPALDWQQWKTPGERLVSLYTQADRDASAAIEQEAQKIAAEKEMKQTEFMKQALAKELMKFEEELRCELYAAYETAADKRTDEQKMLLDKNPSVNITPGVLYQYLPEAAEELKKLDAKIGEVRAKKPAETFVQALVEPAGHIPATKLFHRGDHNQPTRDIVPGKLAVLVPEGGDRSFVADDPSLPTSGRRLAFAKWLTQTDPPNPLFVRALINRVWMHHFGKGIVATAGDFGKLGSVPSHPELLDFLGWELIDHGWSLKHLHRVILQSTAYRQGSERTPEAQRLDPDNQYYSRKELLRLDAEVLRDSVLAISGALSPEMYGAPIPLQEDDAGQVRVDPNQPRRSVYAKWRRTQPVAMLQSFDAPVMGVLCDVRQVSTVATQSLMMLNGDFALQQAERLATRSEELAAEVPAERRAAFDWKLPEPPAATWQFGTGTVAAETGLVTKFTPLPIFHNGQWQGGMQLPDATFGWVLHHAGGGHPGNRDYPAIRRWVAPRAGKLQVRGNLGHGSENGDGVIGSVVASDRVCGKWTAKNGTVDANVEPFDVKPGDVIDFVAACGEHETSDSYTWALTLTLEHEGGQATFESGAGFGGPLPKDDGMLPHQLQAAWKMILHREPSAEEMAVLQRFVTSQLELIQREPGRVPAGSTARRQVLINVCQMLINSNEFLYVD
ncbi:MAG: hypothetical protein RI963_3390 [Planctomycetota bacterium]